MKKTIISTGLVCLLAACHNDEKKTGSTTDTMQGMNDTSHHGMDQGTTTNEMKSLMDQMMMRMHGLKATGNNDIDFASNMLEHHKGAVAMAQLELSKGKDTAMRQFAQQVIDAQQKEIGFMTEFIANASRNVSPDTKKFQDGLMGSMMAMMEDNTPLYNDTDKDFAAQMIPHHQSAVDMANLYLQVGKNESLKKLSRDIVDSQKGEIEWLKTWLKK